jgi:hypothetical protein
MSTIALEQKPDVSPQLRARIAGICYVVTFVGGIYALVNADARIAANIVATIAYFAVSYLFYGIYRPVHKTISAIAAAVSFGALILGMLQMFRLVPPFINNLVFFGVYCLLIGWLTYKSTFLPKFIGVLLAIGGIGWLTFASPALVRLLQPYNMIPGMLGEGVLTLWLVIFGVNAERWNARN